MKNRKKFGSDRMDSNNNRLIVSLLLNKANVIDNSKFEKSSMELVSDGKFEEEGIEYSESKIIRSLSVGSAQSYVCLDKELKKNSNIVQKAVSKIADLNACIRKKSSKHHSHVSYSEDMLQSYRITDDVFFTCGYSQTTHSSPLSSFKIIPDNFDINLDSSEPYSQNLGLATERKDQLSNESDDLIKVPKGPSISSFGSSENCVGMDNSRDLDIQDMSESSSLSSLSGLSMNSMNKYD
jgi:hypothetical protein